MFKHCLWYRILKNNMLHSTISKYSDTFSTPNFIPHITFKHSMDKNKAILEYLSNTPNPEYIFKPYGIPYQTSFNGFHAIQQDLSVQGFSYHLHDYHISLAYNTRRKFTMEEISTVEPLLCKIYPKDYRFELWDCHDPNPSVWFKMR
jgi:hypothetical protein